jgi:predicted AAA+ superfamily ATPase
LNPEISRVAHTTIASYYQILEDCLVAERIDPLLKTKTRRQLIKASKYVFFDLGLRRLAAKEGTQPLFERIFR